MRQTLFRVPLEGPWSLGPLGEWPGFGFGILLAAWVLVGGAWLYRHRQSLSLQGEVLTPAGIWLVIAAAIVLIPQFVRGHYEKRLAVAQQVLQTTAPGEENFAIAYEERDRCWQALREYQSAVETYRAELERDPRSIRALKKLAWLRATSPEGALRDGGEAVELAVRGVELSGSGNDPIALDVLAAAEAEAGDFEQAVEHVQQAAALVYRSEDKYLQARLPEMRRRLALYAADEPYRDDSARQSFPASVPVYGYGFMLCLGAIAAGWSAVSRSRLAGIPQTVIWDLAMWIVISSLAGARAFYLIQKRETVFAEAESLGDYLRIAVRLPDGGLVLYGGVIVGLAVYFLFCRARKLNPLLVGDVIMPSFFVGLAFGRVGCFLNGCCYGDRCELPWSVEFPLGSLPDMVMVERGFVGAAQTLSLALHPAQLYSTLNALVLAFLTHSYFRYRHRNGAVLAMALLTYPVTRFAIEFLRGDELGQFNTPLTISQWVSLGLFGFGLVYLSWLTERPAVLWKWIPRPGWRSQQA